MFVYLMNPAGLGAEAPGAEAPASNGTKMAFVSCPECSYFKNGECVVCGEDENHPACHGCVSGELVWWRRPLPIAIFSSVVVSVATGLIVSKVMKTRALKGLL